MLTFIDSKQIHFEMPRGRSALALAIGWLILQGTSLAAPWIKLSSADKASLKKASAQPGFNQVQKLQKRPQPNPKLGRQLFLDNCFSCHGAEGKGDGDAGSALDPQPANLTLPANYKFGASSLAVFRTVKYGVEGTGMAPWEGRMTDEECWKVVDYVKTLQVGATSTTPR